MGWDLGYLVDKASWHFQLTCYAATALRHMHTQLHPEVFVMIAPVTLGFAERLTLKKALF
jgi:hypothetical protein